MRHSLTIAIKGCKTLSEAKNHAAKEALPFFGCDKKDLTYEFKGSVEYMIVVTGSMVVYYQEE